MCSLVTMIIVVVLPFKLEQIDSPATPLDRGLYDAFGRVAWSIAISYIIFACSHNAGGSINRFLSHRFWQPACRISYAIYLTNLLILFVTMGAEKSAYDFNEVLMWKNFYFNLIVIIFVSIIATIAFEMPFVNIEKAIFDSYLDSKAKNLHIENRNRRKSDESYSAEEDKKTMKIE